MPPSNLGQSSEVPELPHSSTIGSQWMIEKDCKEEKEADANDKEDPLAAMANDLNGHAISAESSAEHPLHSTLQVLEYPAPATSEGSPAADPAPAHTMLEGSHAPAHAPTTSKGSPALAPTTSKGSPASTPAPATSKGSLALAPSLAISEGSPAPTPDDPVHNVVISTPSNTDEKEVEC
jgi:hypothetical protein